MKSFISMDLEYLDISVYVLYTTLSLLFNEKFQVFSGLNLMRFNIGAWSFEWGSGEKVDMDLKTRFRSWNGVSTYWDGYIVAL